MIKELTKIRYLSSSDVIKSLHTEMATLFFGEFLGDNSDDEASEGEPGEHINDTTNFISLHVIIILVIDG